MATNVEKPDIKRQFRAMAPRAKPDRRRHERVEGLFAALKQIVIEIHHCPRCQLRSPYAALLFRPVPQSQWA